jgi:hypothetical protein
MYVVRVGEFRYSCDEVILADTPKHRTHRQIRPGVDALKCGALVAEAALWTSWEHAGDLTSSGDALMLVVNVEKYMKVVESINVALRFAVSYARHFVWHLNRSPQCDLTCFDFDLATIDTNVTSGTDEDHLAFISHYKLEAGTEATLIRSMLEQRIQDDPSNEAAELSSPVFVDSDDLQELAKLTKHVEGSTNLLVLLTPGIFSRPWCLVEMIIAMKNGVQVVPVEVQRPGMEGYQYPDDDWYQALRRGKIINTEGMDLIAQQGFTIGDAELAIKNVFTKIALPFSPHKSSTVRYAEIMDIMKRFEGFAPMNCHEYSVTFDSSFGGSRLSRTSSVHTSY